MTIDNTSSPAQLLQHITHTVPAMRRSERKVAEVVLADPSFVLRATVAGIARAAQVSEPTVIRFCVSLGYDGFQAFRLHLAQAMALGLPISHSAISLQDSVATLTGKIFDHSINALDRARAAMDTAAVDAAVQAVLQADEVLFVGFGASGIIAQDAQQKFALFGRPCSAPSDAHQQYISAITAGPGVVVVAISNTGRTTTVLEIARRARAQGAVVIAITGNDGPLSRESDIALVVRTDEDTDVHTPTVSRLAGLVLIDVLATSVAMALGETHLARLGAMKEGLTRFRASEPEEPDRPAREREHALEG